MSGVHETVDGPGRPSRADAEAAAARIIARRRRNRCAHLERLPDDLLGVVEHVHRYTQLDPPMPPGQPFHEQSQVVYAALLDDFRDAWLITRYLRHAVDAAQLGLIRMAHDDAGHPYSRIAPTLGVTSRQGVAETRTRLSAAVSGHPKDRRAASTARRQERRHAELLDERARTLVAFTRELLQHRRALLALVLQRVAAAADPGGPSVVLDVVDELRYDLDNLADQVAAVAAGRPAPTSMPVVLRLLIESLDESAPGWPSIDPGLTVAVEYARTLLPEGPAT